VNTPLFSRVVLVGVGLIGGSFALALKAAGVVGQVVGLDRSPDHLEQARALGLIDQIATSSAAALRHCDLVVLATPVAQTATVLRSLLPDLEARTLITDTGSTKSDVIAAARAALGPAVARFVPGHPVSGGELHGPAAARVDLFQDRNVVLTPLAENAPADVARVAAAWAACGARVSEMSAAQHDGVLASVSHLPHMLAYALVAQIAKAPDGDLRFRFGGGGFRDFSRIAASSPEMWRDIALSNRPALLEEIDGFSAMLADLRGMIERGDGAALEALFKLASEKRLNWKPG